MGIKTIIYKITNLFKNRFYSLAAITLLLIPFIIAFPSTIRRESISEKKGVIISPTLVVLSPIPTLIPIVTLSNKPTIPPTRLPTPTITITPTPTPKAENTPIYVPLATDTPVPTATPDLTSDKTAPVITIQGGPANNSIVTFTNFCYPLMVTDNVSKLPNLFVRYKLDGDWAEWSNSVAPCFNGVSEGNHTFSVQAKDQVGNLSDILTRTFTINVHANDLVIPTVTPQPIASPTS